MIPVHALDDAEHAARLVAGREAHRDHVLGDIGEVQIETVSLLVFESGCLRMRDV